MMRSPLAFAFALALALPACSDPAPPALTVGAISYSADEVAALDSAAVASLADITAFALTLREDSLGALGEPFVRAAEDSAVLMAFPYHLAAHEMRLNEQELRAEYRADPEWILTVRHIVRLAPPEETDARRTEQLSIATEVRQRALAGEDFGGLAIAFSEEPGAGESGGLIAPGRRGTWVDPFWEAALALQEGEISPVVETPYGFHVLRLENREPVDYEDADLTRVLRRMISPAQARTAMEAWAATQPFDPEETPENRDAEWAAIAREEFGVEPPREATANAEGMWNANTVYWRDALGFRPQMTDEQIHAAALTAISTSRQDVLITREELKALRPPLRVSFPATPRS